MNTTQSYEYQAILEMTPSGAFKHLRRYGIVIEKDTTLPSKLRLVGDYEEAVVTQILIRYIYEQWLCTLEGGECTSVHPVYGGGEV